MKCKERRWNRIETLISSGKIGKEVIAVQIKKFLCILCAFVMSAGCLGVNAGAIQLPDRGVSMVIERASGRFSMDVYAHEVVSANTSFPLEADETVTINATYSPLTASVDFGLIAPDGLFYFVNGTNGSINRSIRVKERGYYTLTVRNNSDVDISVSGFVTY